MIKYINFLVFVFFAACTASSDIPSDFSLTFTSKSELMKWEVNISLNNESLKIVYKNSQNNSSGNWVYTVKQSDAEKIYKYMKSSGFIKTKVTVGEKVLDAPSQNLTGVYNAKSNSIDFGNIKEPPENLRNLKQMLFELSDKYNNNWRKESGME